MPRAAAVFEIGVDHARGEYLHKQQHHELTHRGVLIPHHHVFVLDAYNEIDDHSHAGEKEAARHALTIKHEEEGRIDECRARLTLTDYEKHGYDDDEARSEEVFPLMYVEAIGAHVL